MAELTGRIIYPGDPGWNSSREGFNSRYDYDDNEPQMVVFCQSAQDVINAVKYARKNGLPFRSRCGRHNYQGYSSLVKGGIIIDVSDMESITLDRDNNTATIESGFSMLDLSEKLAESGITFPLATGATVGISGLTLGGGFGVTSRKFGLTCDNLLNAEMVTAQGELINANENENADLFWALRGGGGGNFGIVTSLTFKTHPVALVGIFNVTWTWDQLEHVVDLWQRWSFESDDNLTTLLSIHVDRTITLLGQYTCDATNNPQDFAQLPQLLAPLLQQTLPSSVSISAAPFEVAARMFFGVDPANPQWAVKRHGDQQIFKSTSAIAYDYFNADALKLLREHLEAVPPLSAPPSQPSMVQLLGGGGFPSRIAPDATAVVHREAKIVVQYDGYWTAPQDGPPTVAWVTNFRRAMLPYAHGAYVNYADADLENPLQDYYGSNLPRLVAVKRKYDPENIFNYPQSIPTQLPTEASEVSQ